MHLPHLVRGTLGAIDNRVNGLVNELESLSALPNFSLSFTSALAQLENAALDAKIELRQLYRSPETIARGHFSLTLLSLKELSGTLITVANSLPSDLSLIAGTGPEEACPYFMAVEFHGVKGPYISSWNSL